MSYKITCPFCKKEHKVKETIVKQIKAEIQKEQNEKLKLIRTEIEYTKADIIYSYIIGNEFMEHIQTIVKSYFTLQENFEQEKRLLASYCVKRDREIKLFFQNIATMYADLQDAGAPLQDLGILKT